MTDNNKMDKKNEGKKKAQCTFMIFGALIGTSIGMALDLKDWYVWCFVGMIIGIILDSIVKEKKS